MKQKIKSALISAIVLIGRLLYYLYDETKEALEEVFEKLTQKEHEEAKLGSASQVGRRGEKGFVISHNRRMPLKKSFENLCLFGQIGSGKTTRYIVPSVLRLAGQPCSAIINDPAHQIWEATSGHAFEKGKQIKILNWLSPEQSIGFNFLILCENYSDVKRMVDVLTRATFKGSSGDVFWQHQSRMVIAVFCGLVLSLKDERLHHMLNVSYLIKCFTTAQTDLLDDIVADCPDETLAMDYTALVTMPDKTSQNVMASVATVMEMFDDPSIAQVVSVGKEDNLDFRELRRTPTFLYIHNSVGSNQGYLNVLNSVFYEMLFSSLLESIPKPGELDLFMIFEELSSLYIPLLPSFLANNRKHRVANLLCLQSVSQLEHYKEDKLNITSNCVTTLILPGDHPTDFLKEIEARSGMVSYRDKDDRLQNKPLIPMAEFRLWPADTALVIQAGKPMIRVKTKPFYRHSGLKKLSQRQPVKPHQPTETSTITMIGQTMKKDNHESKK